MMTVSAAGIARRCGGERERAGYCTARCPAHDDAKASLSLKDGRDGVLWKCHAGCTQEAVMAALRAADILEDTVTARRPTVRVTTTPVRVSAPIVATYDYTDEAGELLFQSVRLEPKGFYQRHRASDGTWANHLRGVRLVPYRLPDIVTSTGTVYVPEGEKDVDALRAWGLVATCNPMGAGKWLPAYSEHLRGREVVILPDNDGPGRTHADSILRDLEHVASRVRLVNLPGLPDKGDVSDWIAAGGTRAQLERLVRDAPPATWSTAPVITVEGDWEAIASPITPDAADAPWNVTLPDVAMPGVLGDIIRTVETGTEADPAAILVSLLAACGVAVGLGPRLEIGGTSHYARTHLLIVGRTAEGRKGESWAVVQRIMRGALGEAWDTYEISGLSSGEGLIQAVEDGEREGNEPVPEKRRVVFESEFARTLRVSRREANTLSSVLRQAWDSNSYGIMTRVARRATNVHLAVVGQITPEELRSEVDLLDQQNGLLNRFLLCYSHRRVLRPTPVIDSRALDAHADSLGRVLRAGEPARLYDRDREADLLWREVYLAMNDLSAPIPAVEARGAPMIARLSLLYAVLDGANIIRASHLRAAVEVWWYAVQSTRRAYGERAARFGDPVADAILREFRDQARIEGRRPVVSQSDVHASLGRNTGRGGVTTALRLLAEHGLLERVVQSSDASRKAGRPSVNWRLTDAGDAPPSVMPRWLELARG